MARRIIRRINGRMLAGVLVGSLIAFLLVLGYALLSQNDRVSKTETALKALCLQREDLDQQIAVTETFLHPKTPAERLAAERVFSAIPRKVVSDGQRRRVEFRRNLSILEC